MQRIAYVDGFNFYYGVTRYWDKEKRLAGLGWCNFSDLIERHFPGSGSLRIKYFTAPITPNMELPQHRSGESRRYMEWRRALSTIHDLVVVEGFYKRDDPGMNSDAKRKQRVEKQTDVNIAVEMMADAFGPSELRPHHVFLLSGDYDQMPAVLALQERAPQPIQITVLLPSEADQRDWEESYRRTRLLQGRGGKEITGNPIDVRVLGETMLAGSLLRYTLADSKGRFECPDYWRLPSSYLEKHCPNREWRPDL